MIKISTSILSSNNRIESIKKLNNTNNDYLHIDAMDGIFVPNYQMPVEEIKNLSKYSNKKLDVHLMVEDPEKYINQLANLNIKFITIHLEITHPINSLIELIKSHNYKVGLAIKPGTNIEELYPYINNIDMVLIMSVEPGQGGQKFIPEAIERAKQIIEKKNDLIIEMDGGINNETIKDIKDIVDIAVVGSYIIKTNNYNEAINSLKN